MLCRLSAAFVAIFMALVAIGFVLSIDETTNDAIVLIIAFAAALASYRLTMAGCKAIKTEKVSESPDKNKPGLSDPSKSPQSSHLTSSLSGSDEDLDQDTTVDRKQLGITQSTWQSFTSLQEALSGTEGKTRSAIELVERALYVDEAIEWIATGAIENLVGAWQDASIILTDQHLFVAFESFKPGTYRLGSIQRDPDFKFKQLQNLGGLARLQIAGFGAHCQLLALAPEHLFELKERLAAIEISPSYSPTSSSPIENPTAALTTIKELLDSGLITQEDYEQKKKEILERL